MVVVVVVAVVVGVGVVVPPTSAPGSFTATAGRPLLAGGGGGARGPQLGRVLLTASPSAGKWSTLASTSRDLSRHLGPETGRENQTSASTDLGLEKNNISTPCLFN